jgi:hypothetical protein
MLIGRGLLNRNATVALPVSIPIAFDVNSLIPQQVFTNVFPPAEFAAGRAQLMKAIGHE